MRKRALLILLLAVLLGILFQTKGLDILAIKSVEWQINNLICASKDQIKGDFDLLGDNILAVSQDNLQHKLTQRYRCIKSVQVENRLPNFLKLTVEGRIPVSRVIAYNSLINKSLKITEASPSSQSAILDWSFPQRSAASLLVDEGGLIFCCENVLENFFSLPLLFWPTEKLSLGDSLDKVRFQKISLIFSKIKEMEGLNFTVFGSSSIQAKMFDEDLLIDGYPRLVFDLNRDVLVSLASLQLILNKAKIDGDRVDIIDVRFDRPVVVFSKP